MREIREIEQFIEEKIRCRLNWVGELPIYLALKKEEGKKENLGDLELCTIFIGMRANLCVPLLDYL